MTELQLYKFIQENNIEWHWRETDNGQDVFIWISPGTLGEWCENMLGYGFFDDGGLEVTLTHGGHTVFEMNDICEHFNIEIENVFPK